MAGAALCFIFALSVIYFGFVTPTQGYAPIDDALDYWYSRHPAAMVAIGVVIIAASLYGSWKRYRASGDLYSFFRLAFYGIMVTAMILLYVVTRPT